MNLEERIKYQAYAAVAQELGVTQAQLRRMIKGIAPISLEQGLALASYLKCHPQDILDGIRLAKASEE